MNDLKKYIYTKSPGEKVNLTIKRGERETNLEVDLGYKMQNYYFIIIFFY